MKTTKTIILVLLALFACATSGTIGNEPSFEFCYKLGVTHWRVLEKREELAEDGKLGGYWPTVGASAEHVAVHLGEPDDITTSSTEYGTIYYLHYRYGYMNTATVAMEQQDGDEWVVTHVSRSE